MTNSRVLPLLCVPLVVACVAVWWIAWHPPQDGGATAAGAKGSTSQPAGPAIPFEDWARMEFARRHPGEQPLNWRIADKAEEFYRTKPMGAFVLGKNDCSDFTDAILDDALGARARFRRGSQNHILANEPSVWEFYRWEPNMTVMPGDEIAVRHSPNYPPYLDAPWHRGIVGTDGMVYDWTRLKAWSSDRYGRHDLEWFVHNSRGPGDEVIIRRLRAVYRYCIEPVPIHGVPSPRTARAPAGKP
jgi:hypothetical protein